MNRLPFLTLILIFSILFTACNQETETPEDLVSAIQKYNQDDDYERAFEMLDTEEAREHENFHQLKLATHMNYALHLTYEAEQVAMTTRMPNALRHFRKVLEMDPDNERAKAEIALIEGIYNQLGRDIPEGVAN